MTEDPLHQGPVAPGIEVLPVRTPTLPPATHTNTYVVGDARLWVFDPASPYEDEQERLLEALSTRIDAGATLEGIVLTHHHGDHVGGAKALKQAIDAPLYAHRITAELVSDIVEVDVFWSDEEVRDCGGRSIKAHFTPGHAPGHLCFEDLESQAVIAGDMVAGVGTIVIAPHEGDLGEYLASLEHLRTLDPSVLLPAHGPALPQADAILSFYIAHRHQRTEQIRAALQEHGTSSPMEIVPHVYPEIPESVHPLAAGQILSHLRWMAEHGLATDLGNEATWRAQ